ncbi:helix-turn-helix domain-containing protein [Modestobacter sp. NPDC049651]|uniref:helix-turn-helix domain-containing protein n=1 Tax=unclassified Modestobacter TaxID=2643866 RepID=UPI0033D1C740
MDRNGQRAAPVIPEVGFAAPAGSPPGVEVLPLAELRTRVDASVLAAPQRPAFHHLVSVTSGELQHTVDFTRHGVAAGEWLWVRPGQVQQWHDLARAEGVLVLFEPDFLDPATTEAAALGDPHAPALLVPPADDEAVVREAVRHLQHAFDQPRTLPPDVQVVVLRHLLAVLVLRLAHLAGAGGTPAGPLSDVFLAYRDAVERDVTRVRRVEDHARALGWSPRTLSRATTRAVGVGAKEYLDRRVVLEAKRLLAHSDRSAAQVAVQLGFASATQFGAFFARRVGTSPLAFRARVRGSVPGGPASSRP